MAKYELKDNVVQNILIFLQQVNYKGENNFIQIDAIQEIRHALLNPIIEEGVKNETNV